MSYRIKVPAKTLAVDEAHLSSWVDHTLHGSRDYRRPVLIGLGVVVLAAAVVGGVFYVDRQTTQKAQDLDQEAMRFLTAPSANDPQKADHARKEAITRYRQIVDQYPQTLPRHSPCTIWEIRWSRPMSWARRLRPISAFFHYTARILLWPG